MALARCVRPCQGSLSEQQREDALGLGSRVFYQQLPSSESSCRTSWPLGACARPKWPVAWR
eukprot:8831407-Pyramimonas_sp.AAC.1